MDQKSRSVKDCWKRSMVFMGLDWAKDHHQILILDREGHVVLDRQIEHTAEGWHQLREKLSQTRGDGLVPCSCSHRDQLWPGGRAASGTGLYSLSA